ncbi:IS1182 family transposase [Catenuloplanes japonicus]|uniref:IS1182 family transposase n=1 Tax=Catenuloplanes japonicus TaxID=33876 RepID=UPI000A0F85AA|nr:IS1182 family transposase [Catenuloplanes japonicus]
MAEIREAVRVIHGSRQRPLPVVVRDELGEVFADAAFAEAFGVSGPAGWSPGRLALVTVLQMAENLTDRQAAEAVRDKISWKYALGLSLSDPGFDFSVLSQFRARIVAHGLEARVLDLLVGALAGRGLLKARGKQRTDSTHVLAAVRDLNRVELAGETVRAALEAVAAADPGWLASVIEGTGWQQRYGQRVDGWRLPASKSKRDEIGNGYGRDARTLLEAVYAPGTPQWLARLPAVDVLRLVLVQNFVTVTDRQGREVVRMREADTDGLPPGRSKITSPYDIDARRGRKRDLGWNGYKLHISETCDAVPAPPGPATGTPPPPNLITNVVTTDASVADTTMTAPIHADLARRGLLPAAHYVDSGYPSAALLVSSRTDHQITLVTPLLADTSRQARAADGYDRTAFTIDHDQRQATCPQGHPSGSWTPAVQRGNPVIVIRFPTGTCRPCPVKTLCTTADRGRQITTRPHAVQHALDHARTAQDTPQWQATYNLRAGIESAIAQSVKVTDTRRARYRGLPKTRLEHTFKATALNLIRLHAWWTGHHLTPQHTTHLARLEHTP